MSRSGLYVSIKNCGEAKRTAFIYLLFSPEPRCLYVGQTVSRAGALGRLAQHMGNGYANTFQQRVCALFGYEEVALKNVEFAAVPLTDRQELNSDAREYREAVEFLVQQAIIEIVKTEGLRCAVLSRVAAGPYCSLDFIRDEAAAVMEILGTWLSESAAIEG